MLSGRAARQDLGAASTDRRGTLRVAFPLADAADGLEVRRRRPSASRPRHRADAGPTVVAVVVTLAAGSTSGYRVPAVRRLRALEIAAPAVVEPAEPSDAAAPRSLTARNLTLRWPGATADTVAGLDLRLRGTHRVALVGPSGSGKSTVVAALLRMLDPRAGWLLADDRDVHELRGDDVRRSIAWCGSWTHLFDSTLRANLALAAPDATDAELVEGLGRAQLGAWFEPAARRAGHPRRRARRHCVGWGTAAARRGAGAARRPPDHPARRADRPPRRRQRRRAGCRDPGGDARADSAGGHPPADQVPGLPVVEMSDAHRCAPAGAGVR